MKDDNLKKILELESENKTLRAEVEQLKRANLIYSEANFSTIDLGQQIDELKNARKPECCADVIDNNNTESE